MNELLNAHIKNYVEKIRQEDQLSFNLLSLSLEQLQNHPHHHWIQLCEKLSAASDVVVGFLT